MTEATTQQSIVLMHPNHDRIQAFAKTFNDFYSDTEVLVRHTTEEEREKNDISEEWYVGYVEGENFTQLMADCNLARNAWHFFRQGRIATD